MARNSIEAVMWQPPNTRVEELSERDSNRAMRKEWRDRRNRTERPGFEVLQNMRYKGNN